MPKTPAAAPKNPKNVPSQDGGRDTERERRRITREEREWDTAADVNGASMTLKDEDVPTCAFSF